MKRLLFIFEASKLYSFPNDWTYLLELNNEDNTFKLMYEPYFEICGKYTGDLTTNNLVLKYECNRDFLTHGFDIKENKTIFIDVLGKLEGEYHLSQYKTGDYYLSKYATVITGSLRGNDSHKNNKYIIYDNRVIIKDENVA